MARKSTKKSPNEAATGFDTFVLCVGAQKSGTTWLHKYLADHPQTEMPLIKELHYFDIHFNPDMKNQRLDKARRRHEQAKKRAPLRADYAQLAEQLGDRLAMDGAPISSYLQLFRNLKSEQKVTGDFTPTYSALNDDQFKEIRELLVSAGMKVKVVFLMRDPVARAFSSVKMMAGKREVTDPEIVKSNMMRRIQSKGSTDRGNYHDTIAALDAAFQPDEVFYEFFENLFEEKTLKSFCKFVGIDYVPGDFNESPNPTPDYGKLTAEEHAKAYELLADVYNGCRTKFGPKIPATWAKGA